MSFPSPFLCSRANRSTTTEYGLTWMLALCPNERGTLSVEFSVVSIAPFQFAIVHTPPIKPYVINDGKKFMTIAACCTVFYHNCVLNGLRGIRDDVAWRSKRPMATAIADAREPRRTLKFHTSVTQADLAKAKEARRPDVLVMMSVMRGHDDLIEDVARDAAFVGDMETLLIDGLLGDVVVKLGDAQYNLHRAILSVRSVYFKAMFSKGFAEAKQPIVELKDMDANAFKIVLKYLYTGSAGRACAEQPDLPLWVAVYETADMLGIAGLKKSALTTIGLQLCNANVLDCVNLSERHPEVRAVALDYLEAHHIEDETLRALDADVARELYVRRIAAEHVPRKKRKKEKRVSDDEDDDSGNSEASDDD